ncbi:MAG: hypothetical protein IJ210_04005 [Clostridia bacterium]|nr:hypothetical protein [Clostridia bacterium]
MDHFQRKAGRQALEKPANKHFANSSRFALLAAFPTVNLRFQLMRRKRPMDRIGEKKIMPALWQARQMYHILHSCKQCKVNTFCKKLVEGSSPKPLKTSTLCCGCVVNLWYHHGSANAE